MKAIKFYMLMIGSLIFSAAGAQEYATDVSVGEQIKKGTVPGTKISTTVPKKKTAEKESMQKISVPVKQQLLNGTYPGLTVTKTPAAKAAPVAAKKEEVSLPSSNKPVPAKPAQPAPVPVMQDEQKAVVEKYTKAATQH